MMVTLVSSIITRIRVGIFLSGGVGKKALVILIDTRCADVLFVLDFFFSVKKIRKCSKG